MPKILRVACKIKKDLLYKQVFYFLMRGIAALVALARNDNARPSLRGHLCPWQSHTWNKKSCYTFLMAEIATLALLARNDKGIPQGIAALVALARNDKGIPQGIAALVSFARNDNARPSLRGHLCPWQSPA